MADIHQVSVEQTNEDCKQEGCTAVSNKGADWLQPRVSCPEAVSVAELGPVSPPCDSKESRQRDLPEAQRRPSTPTRVLGPVFKVLSRVCVRGARKPGEGSLSSEECPSR